jgi:carotenoid 1,2-hydratase
MVAPGEVALPRTRWQLPRRTRSEAGQEARLLKTLEDAPFYSRSLIEAGLFGSRAVSFHESLSLDRFRTRWVQCLLPFRMPRIA